MRRPRRRLEVSTFPFLAVLLCAMGSLILLLLVLDRRAKAVARAKAEEAVQVARAERDAAARAVAEAAAQRAAERAAEREQRERRRLALHDQLARTKGDLDDQLRSAEGRKADADRAVSAHRTHWRELLEVLGNQRQELAQAEQEASAGRGAIAEAEEMSESARKEAEGLSTRLRGLELVLAELKAARQREAQTYSLLPYRGRRGDSRRPLYIECTANGLMFHPDRRTLSRIAADAEIRAEVETRVEWQRKRVLAKGGQPDKRPYLLMLVRPDGIPSYYATVAALQGREIDFGYEFIDADWALDFPEDDTTAPTQPWMTAHRTPVAPSDPSAPTRKVTGLHPGRTEDGTESGEGDGGTAAGSAVARGGPSDLPPLPGTTGGGVGGLPSGGVPGATSAAPGGGGPGGAGGGSDLPPLPGSPGGTPGVGLRTGAAGAPGRGIPDQDGSLRGRPTPSAGAPVAMGQSTLVPAGPWVAAGAPAGPPRVGSGGGGTGGGTGSSSDLPPLQPGSGGSGAGSRAGSPNPDGTLPGTPRAPPEGGASPGQPAGTPGAAPGPSSGSPPLYPDGGAAPPPPAGGQPTGATTGGQAAGSPGSEGLAVRGQPGQGGTATPHDPDEPQAPRLDAGQLHGPEKPSPRAAPPRPPRLIGNRDWVIPVECRADGVVVRNLGQKIPLASLSVPAGTESPLLQAVKQMIARRQASVRSGEPPYRPQVRFMIYPDGLRTYFLTFPSLEPLGIPLTRQNVEADASPRPAP
jgi:hypothetical protein